ncbi:LmeA family phospholipid-binding protein [Streptomyces sp. NPDC052012]|uniref:LmeA family phospholipid-binding protein n=1 Tax=Streptomyces sp. NPDC052012 TaxID=3155051 RepID=UPI003450CEEB
MTAHHRPNPYEELGALDEGPLQETRLEDFLGREPWDPGDPEDPVEGAGSSADGEGPEDPWSPPVHRRGSRRRRRRFSTLPLAAKALVAVLVLTAFLTLADRWAVLYAEHRAADVLRDRMHLAAAPEVEIGGFPFLTQVADGRLDSVRLTVPDVAADRVSLARVSATARDVRLDTDGPVSIRGAHAPRLDGEVLLSFADLNRELGASQVTFTGVGGDRVRARGTLPVAGHELRVSAQARIQRDGERGISTSIDGMRLDIGELATYRPGTRASQGLHLTPAAAADVARESRKAKALLSLPAMARRLGVPDGVIREALSDDGKLAELTGSPRFARQAVRLNLVDLALDHPEALRRLGLDPKLLDTLTHLTRPALADRLSLAFDLPAPTHGDLRLRDVRVEKEGIRVRVTGEHLTTGH